MKSETIDLVYLDPPFFTQRKQELKDKTGKIYSFDDSWDSLTDYLSFIEARIIECRRLLKNSGSLFLHCDSTASHHLRLILDRVFGIERLQSEIIWSYKRWSNSKKGLLNAHQTIFFYSKTENFKFNTIYTDYSPATNVDQILQDRVRNELGKAAYRRDEKGNIIFTNEKKGVPLSDVWEIPFLNPKAKERVGYPTQKPILLLERILEIASNKSDVILDPFCGSGSTIVAAHIMGRTAIGIDSNPAAIQITKERLINPVKTRSSLMENGRDSYSTKNDWEINFLEQLNCIIVQRNRGIDAILRKRYNNGIVSIKIQKKSESFYEAVSLLDQASKKKNCTYSILIKTQDSDDLFPSEIPDNMLIINSYELEIRNYLERTYV